jgi:hypothetical protein
MVTTLFPERGGTDGPHQHVQHLAMSLEDGNVVNRLQQLRRLLELLGHDPGKGRLAGRSVGGRLRPEGDQRGETELTAKRKP